MKTLLIICVFGLCSSVSAISLWGSQSRQDPIFHDITFNPDDETWDPIPSSSHEQEEESDPSFGGIIPTPDEPLEGTSEPAPEALPDNTQDEIIDMKSKLDTVLTQMQELQSKFQILEDENRNLVDKLYLIEEQIESTNELKNKLDTMSTQIQEQQNKLQILEDAKRKIVDKTDQLEKHTKSNSVVFYNVSEKKNENYYVTLQKVLHIINRMMRVRMSSDDIAIAKRINIIYINNTEVNPAPVPRPIVIRFVNMASKLKVLAATRRLWRSNIIVTPDYSEREAEVRSALVPFAEMARAQGHAAFIVDNRLVVDGVSMILEQLQKNLPSPTIEPHFEEEPDEQVEEVEVDPIQQEQTLDYSY